MILCGLLMLAPPQRAQAQDVAAPAPKWAWKLEQVRELLCPGQEAPHVFHWAAGEFSTRAPGRVDFMVMHAPCVREDGDTTSSSPGVQTQLSWFYAKGGEPVRLSQSNFSRRLTQCVDGAHHGGHHVYCIGSHPIHGGRSLYALKFHAWHSVLALRLMEDRPPEQGCPKGVLHADALVELVGLKGDALTFTSRASTCARSTTQQDGVQRARVGLTHRVRLSAKDYVVMHHIFDAQAKRVGRGSHDLLKTISRYNQIPVFRDAKTGQILVRQREGLPQ